MASEPVQVDVGESGPVRLDFEKKRWTAERAFAEGDFPLIALVRGKRYELYSDGTFNEEELDQASRQT
jgi:hypothetical protein